jgi:hypothetical protein
MGAANKRFASSIFSTSKIDIPSLFPAQLGHSWSYCRPCETLIPAAN